MKQEKEETFGDQAFGMHNSIGNNDINGSWLRQPTILSLLTLALPYLGGGEPQGLEDICFAACLCSWASAAPWIRWMDVTDVMDMRMRAAPIFQGFNRRHPLPRSGFTFTIHDVM